MKNKILLGIIVILLPIAFYILCKKENINPEVTHSSQKDIYIRRSTGKRSQREISWDSAIRRLKR